MKTTVRMVGQVAVVDLSGKITIGEGDVVLRDKIQELLDSGHQKILLNLEKVSYMDSAGIGELMATHGKVTLSGGSVKLLNPHKRVYDVLHIVKLHSVLATFHDEATALAAFD